MRKTNFLKQKFESGTYTIGTFNQIPSSDVVNIIGCAGFDFVIIDAEHGPVGMEKAGDLIRAAESEGMSPIIRVSENDPALICRALDIGAHGVQIPLVSNKTQAEAAVRYAKYSPLGERGLCPFARSGLYSLKRALTYTVEANENTLVVLNVEGVEGIARLEEIFEVKNVDIIFVGPYDLSLSLGKPGMVDDPEVVNYIRSCAKKIRDAGFVAGCFASSVDMMKMLIDCGYQYLAYSVDAPVMLQAFEQAENTFRAHLETTTKINH